jgi:hypothetical protein
MHLSTPYFAANTVCQPSCGSVVEQFPLLSRNSQGFLPDQGSVATTVSKNTMNQGSNQGS